MPEPLHVLAAASRSPGPAATARRRVLVVGGGGALGSATLEALLGLHRFAQVGVAACRPVSPAVRGLTIVDDSGAAWRDFGPDSALIVFDRTRHANGRDDAFSRPQPHELPHIAARLQIAGVRHLVIAVPHAPALLPQALRAGLASLDEGAVAAMGFEHLVLMRLAQVGAASDAAVASAPQRLAAWMLRQLHWMIPSSELPVRAATVARVAAQLALELPAAPAGTRVLPPELLRHAAQGLDAADLVPAWLAGRPMRPLRAPPVRM